MIFIKNVISIEISSIKKSLKLKPSGNFSSLTSMFLKVVQLIIQLLFPLLSSV